MSKILFTDFFGVVVHDSGNLWLKEHNLFEHKKEIFPLGDLGLISEDEVFSRLSKVTYSHHLITSDLKWGLLAQGL